MPLTPEDVRQQEFRTAFRGYNMEEVDNFLDEVESELERLLTDSALRQQSLPAQAPAAPPAPATPPAPAPAPVAAQPEADEMLQRILLLAQRTADETIADARAEAERIRAEAREEAASLVARAQGELDRSMGDLEATRQALEQRVEELRAFEREYRGRLRTFLQARLTELEKQADAGAADTGGPGAGSGAVRSQARRGAGSAPRG